MEVCRRPCIDLFKLGGIVGNSRCHYVECSVVFFFFFSVCAPLVCDGRSSFLERIACCVKSKHKEVFVSTRTDADLSAPRD